MTSYKNIFLLTGFLLTVTHCLAMKANELLENSSRQTLQLRNNWVKSIAVCDKNGIVFTTCKKEADGPFGNNNNYEFLFSQAQLTQDFLNQLDLASPMPKILQNLKFIKNTEIDDDVKSSLFACCSNRIQLVVSCISPLDNINSIQFILLIKLEYAYQKGKRLCIGTDWAQSFFKLPEFMRKRYFRTVECIVEDVSDVDTNVASLTNSFGNMNF